MELSVYLKHPKISGNCMVYSGQNKSILWQCWSLKPRTWEASVLLSYTSSTQTKTATTHSPLWFPLFQGSVHSEKACGVISESGLFYLMQWLYSVPSIFLQISWFNLSLWMQKKRSMVYIGCIRMTFIRLCISRLVPFFSSWGCW